MRRRWSSAGLIHVPEGRRLFAGMSVRDNLLVGAYHQASRKAMADDIERVFTLFPRLRERPAPERGNTVGRRAADVRHRPRIDGAAEAAR